MEILTREQLEDARLILKLKPGGMARSMGISYDHYKHLGKRRAIRANHVIVVNLLLDVRGTRKGRKYGV